MAELLAAQPPMSAAGRATEAPGVEVRTSEAPGVEVRTSEAPGADLAAELEGVRLLVVVDAALAGDDFPPGTWRRIDYGRDDARLIARHLARPAVSGHTLGVAEGLELARALGVLPPTVWIYVIAGGDFGYGAALTAPVEAAVSTVADQIRADVAAWQA